MNTFIGMKKFKNTKTSDVFIVTSPTIQKQMQNSEDYKEVERTDSEMTVKEIKVKLDELNIEYNKKATKKELLDLLPQE